MKPYLIDRYLNLPIYTDEKNYWAILDPNQKTEEEKQNCLTAFIIASSTMLLIQKIDKFIADQPKIKAISVANAILDHGNVEYVDLIKIGENYYDLNLIQHNEYLSEEVLEEKEFKKIVVLKRRKDDIFETLAKYDELLEPLTQYTRELLKANNRFEQYKLKK